MKIPSLILAGAVVLAAGLVSAQDEQSSAAAPSAAFWSHPRVEPDMPAAAGGAAPARAQKLSIENETLQVQFDSQSGRMVVTSKTAKRAFLANANFNQPGGAAKVIRVSDRRFGSGRAIEVTHANGNRDVVMLFPKYPFAMFRSTIKNSGSEPTITRVVRPFETTVDLGKPAGELRAFGTGGLMGVDANPGSYTWLAIADPQTRNGVVFGWISQERGNGVLFSRVQNNSVNVGGQIDYGRLRLAPGKSEEMELLAVGYFEDARLGLETWADTVATYYNIQLKEQPTGYCTWYSQPNGGAADEKSIITLSEFAARELAPFGFSVVQIDDRWQDGWKRSSPSSPKKDFRQHDPNGPYPGGMKAPADKIKSLGLVPGIWFMPFAGTVGDPFFDQHLDWFVKTTDGKPFDTPWGGTSLDMTHPGARAHLRDVASRICRQWGYDYIKIDGLWTGTATRQMYVNSGYRDDRMGEAVFHNPDKTNLEAYRDGLKLVRESIGRSIYILGCNGPQNMRSYGGAFGLVDGMRVGPDNNSDWNRLTRGPLFGTRHYFMHGRVWHNDPDPVYVRQSMPLNHAQLICSWVAVSGQLNLSSEWLPGLPPERLDILKRTMPGHGLLPRPVDLFDKDLPSVWVVTDDRTRQRRDLVGLFNWDNREQQFEYSFSRLGLDASQPYIAFDYWANQLVPVFQGQLKVTVPGQSCAILAVRPAARHPQLISTSRHVTQGIVDVVDERWNGRSRTLSGRSKLVAGDPYELRIVAPDRNWSVKSVKTSGGKSPATFTQDGQLIRATIPSPSGGEVNWTVEFN